MKTYIWNSECMVYMVSAENEQQARSILISTFCNRCKDYIIDGIDLEKLKTNCLPTYVYNRACSIFFSDFPVFLDTINKSPDNVLDEKKALIYNHANE